MSRPLVPDRYANALAAVAYGWGLYCGQNAPRFAWLVAPALWFIVAEGIAMWQGKRRAPEAP